MTVSRRRIVSPRFRAMDKVAIARVTRTLGTLIACGVPILESLRITAKTAGNQIVEDTVMMARAAIAAGPLGVADAAEIVFACLPSQNVSREVAREIAKGKAIRLYVETSTIGTGAMAALLRARA